MTDLLDRYTRALGEFGRRVHPVQDDQWHQPTPCTEWDVRELVNHVVCELRWAVPLLEGSTVAAVGDRFGGDLLGADPVGAWDDAASATRAAFAASGALSRTVHLSYGDAGADEYLQQLTMDLVVHAWDLARGVGTDDRLDPELVREIFERVQPQAGLLQQSGMFAPPVPAGPGADIQTRMLALLGRSA